LARGKWRGEWNWAADNKTELSQDFDGDLTPLIWAAGHTLAYSRPSMLRISDKTRLKHINVVSGPVGDPEILKGPEVYRRV